MALIWRRRWIRSGDGSDDPRVRWISTVRVQRLTFNVQRASSGAFLPEIGWTPHNDRSGVPRARGSATIGRAHLTWTGATAAVLIACLCLGLVARALVDGKLTATMLAADAALLAVTGFVATASYVVVQRRQREGLCAELETAREDVVQLQARVRQKAEFNRMLAHELNSPLAAVRGYADILATQRLSDAARDCAIAAIRSEAALLTALVADVHATSRLERDDFAVCPRPVTLHALVADGVRFAGTLPGDHPLTMPLATSELVWADPERIGQVLRNLLTNAAKHSPAGTPIEVRVRREGASARIEVADRGPGIDSDDLPHIFEKFRRGRASRDGQVRGAGLGLYISHQIVAALGSTLTVDSTPGIGSTFGFTLEIVV